MFNLKVILSVGLALGCSLLLPLEARADEAAVAGMNTENVAEAGSTTTTLKDVVDNKLPPDVKAHFLAQARKEDVNIDEISDVEVTVDAKSENVVVSGVNGKHTRNELIFVGTQIGILFPFGVTSSFNITRDDHPEWDFDVSWEPSNYWQSYSVGAAYHPFKNIFFVGSRVRFMQLHAPWSEGYDSHWDNQLGVGVEAGIRGFIGKGQRFLGWLSVGAIYVPSGNIELPVMYTLNVGLALRVFKKN